MSNWNYRNDETNKDEIPPYSRIFIVCSKDLREEDLTLAFEKYGEIENLFIPKDRNSGAPRGVAYIKYAKTSSAAAAIEALHQKSLGNKTIKVMIASKKNDDSKSDHSETRNRLFIKIPKQATECDIRDIFSKYGNVDSIHIQRDKSTNESKGLAYVQFKSFFEAAKAFEECEKKYRPVFAAPKNELKRGRHDRDSYNENFNSHFPIGDFNNYGNVNNDMLQHRGNMTPAIRTPANNYRGVIVTCAPMVAQRYLERLFNIVPGMLNFQYTEDSFNGFSRAIVTYEDERSAAHAVDRLNNFEFPSGQVVTVKPDNPLSKAADDLTSIVSSFKNAVDNGTPDLVQLADAIAQASSLIKAATSGRLDAGSDDKMLKDPNLCSVSLPPIQPLAPQNSQVAQRCFIVCKPYPPPQPTLQNIFCRFGDLIELDGFPNKTFAFAKYASSKAAQQAIKTLHGATLYGSIKLKVMEAEDPKPSKRDGLKMDIDSQENANGDNKRMRLIDDNQES